MIYPILKLCVYVCVCTRTRTHKIAHPLLDRKRAIYTGDEITSRCKMLDVSAGIQT